MVDTQFITVSGQPTFEKFKIDFPSGVFNVPARAVLSSFNATFGFNTQPHAFELEYVPAESSALASFQAETGIPISSGVAFFAAGDFFIKGRIKHYDYNKSLRGNILTIRVEDVRTDLDDFFLDTFGVFGSQDAPSAGIVDVRYWFVRTRIDTITGNQAERKAGRSRAFRDLSQLEESGASYRQIYEAVKFFEEDIGTVFGLLETLPRPEVIESQLPLDPDAYRWKFKAQPFLQSMSRILSDVSYDFYWNMAEGKIDVINRRFPVTIDKDEVPIANDPAEQPTIRFGEDEAERPTTIRIYGAEMEGMVGCGPFKNESGAYGFTLPSGGPSLEHDLGISVCKSTPSGRQLLFEPGWTGTTVKYFGPDGALLDFEPSDRILAAAIKGIEYFAKEVDLDNRIDNSTIDVSTGETTNQFSFVSSSGKLGIIANRGQPGRSWILEWYNRVRNFAQNHYSRTYVLSKDAPLYDFIDEIEVPEEAWVNIENQTDDGSFEDNYKISDRFKFLAPFWNSDTNKMKPFATLEGAKWGNDGNGVPAQFDQWNEDESTQIVPIEVRKWNRANDKFKEEFLRPLRQDEKGIMIRLPNLCWAPGSKGVPDNVLNNVLTLQELRLRFQGNTTIDTSDPTELLTPFVNISGAAIPIKVKRRYGLKFPSVWASGAGLEREVDIREDFAPWNFEPRGIQQSWELMDEEARSALASRVVNRNSVTFAESTKIGLPIISFDSFADQKEQSQGYGLVKHGVTNLSVSNNLEGWWQTKYSLKSHFGQVVKVQPVFDRADEDFNFVIKRLEEDIRRRIPPDIFQPPESFDLITTDGREVFSDSVLEKFQIPVTITKIFDRGSDEFYAGIDDRGITWPRALDSALSLSPESQAFQQRKASAVDGFLQIGMRGVYNFEELEDGTFVHFFTGGVSLADARVVRLRADSGGNVVRTVSSGGSSVIVANVETLPTVVTNPDTGETSAVTPFTYFNVPFIAQAAVDEGLAQNQEIVLSTHGNKNNKGIPPNGDFGPAGDNFNDAFLVNSGAPSDIDFAEVTISPSATTGLGGEIQIVTSAGGEIIADGSTAGGSTRNVRFVGAEFGSIRAGDNCIVKQVTLSGSSDVNVFCFIVKPKFVPTSAFG